MSNQAKYDYLFEKIDIICVMIINILQKKT